MSFYTDVFVYKGKIHYRGIKNNKAHIKLSHNYSPYLFLEDSEGEFKTIKDVPVKKKIFNSIWDAKEFIKKYEGSNVTIYGMTEFQYTFLNDLFPKEIEYDTSLINIGYIDIETLQSLDISAPEPITAITLRCNGLSHVFGCGIFETDASDVCYHHCENEEELLHSFLIIWQQLNLDIISGYNIRLFDIPYLFNRIKNILGERDALKLSPWKLVFEKIISSQGKECVTFDIKGICILDYFDLYKKFTFKNHESYRLDYIGHEELGEGKVDYSEYAGLLDLYYNNHQKFIEYNIRDVLIVEKLEEKLGFIALVVALAYDAKCNYIDVLTTIRPWDIIIHNYLLERGIVIPPMKQHIIPDNEVLFGGYVKESKEGLHEWVESIDLTSLYPHLIMMYNIGPDTFIGKVKAYYEFEMNNVVLRNAPDNKDCAITANGCMYRRDKQGFMAALMEGKFKNRKFFKKKMLAAKKTGDKGGEILFHNKQYAMKIQLNSLFGSLLNIHNRWFDFNNGNAITTTGQLVAKYINNVLNILLNDFFKTVNVDYIVAQDTDSAYICLDRLAKQYPNKERKELVKIIVKFVEDKILTYLNERFEHFAKVTNAREQKLDMKLEKVSNRALFTTKKRYVLNALYDEGVYYNEAKLEIKGLEAVKSSTPQVCREQLKKSLSIIMNEDEKSLHKAVKTFKETFLSLPFEDIASPRSANGIDKYQDNETIYKKGTPIHVRGSLLYNKLLKKYNIKNTQPVQNGDKIKFIYLKNPNPLHENVIASPGTLPKEFGLEKYIDRNLQFKKVFLEPLQGITRIINWEVIPTVRLSEFYKN